MVDRSNLDIRKELRARGCILIRMTSKGWTFDKIGSEDLAGWAEAWGFDLTRTAGGRLFLRDRVN